MTSAQPGWAAFAERCREIAARPARRLDPLRPVWIFGTGSFGRDLAAVLRQQGYLLAGFVETAPRQDSVLGLPVRSWQQLGDADRAAQLAVGIFNRGMPFDGLFELGRTAGFAADAVFLPWHLYAQFEQQLGWRYWLSAPSTILEALPEIEATWHSLSDDTSRQCLLDMLAFRMDDQLDYASVTHDAPQYFNDLTLPALAGRPVNYLDGGAYNGDTYLDLCGKTQVDRAWLFEPDPANYSMLVDNVAGSAHDVQCLPCAVADRFGILSFNASGEGGAIVASGTQRILTLALDQMFPNQTVTMLKLDVEGAEQAALRGARALIARSRPVLALSLYHLPRDPWEIPALVRSMCPDYRFYLRQHFNNSFDCVFYAVPNPA